MTDRELLELAAKAAGVIGAWARTHQTYGDTWIEGLDCGGPVYWNPLEDDGAALRLAVKLRMNIDIGERPVEFTEASLIRDDERIGAEEYHDCDPYAATRRAITRAAAEIGKEMS